MKVIGPWVIDIALRLSKMLARIVLAMLKCLMKCIPATRVNTEYMIRARVATLI